MSDIPILLMVLSLAIATWLRPWIGVLALIIVETLPPQGFATGFMREFPAYALLFALLLTRLGVGGVTGLARQWRAPADGLARWLPPRVIALAKDWQVWVLLLLWVDFLLTTWFAKDPWAAWPQFWVVTKVMVPVLFTLLLIDSREKLIAMLVVLALSVAAATLKGGYWALMTGFQDRVYGPPGSPYEGNNEFSVVVLMTLPLLLAFRRQTLNPGVRLGLLLLFALGCVAVLSSWSRGAFLGLGVVIALIIWHSRKKWLALPVLALATVLGFTALPARLLERMQSISQYQQDQSAQGRLEAWQAGIDYVRGEPWLGAGFEGWRFMTTDPYTSLGRDWHSVYVQVLTEHGLPGLILWSVLLFGGMVRLSRLAAKGHRPGAAHAADLAAMLRAGLAGYAISGAFLGIAYWSVFFQFIAWVVLLELLERRSVNSSPPARKHLALHSLPGGKRPAPVADNNLLTEMSASFTPPG